MKTELILERSFNQIEQLIQCYGVKYKGIRDNELLRKLYVVVLSDDSASLSYANNKVKMGKKYNVNVILVRITTKTQLHSLIEKVKQEKNAKIIFQYPFDFSTFGNMSSIMKMVDDYQDVDGFKYSIADISSLNGDMYSKILRTSNFSPTAKFVLTIIHECRKELGYSDIKGLNIAVIGQGLTSGLPIALICEKLGATVSWVNSNTNELVADAIISSAEVVISCTGKRNVISKNGFHSCQDNAIYINVGMSRNPETGKLEGDINPDVAELDNTFFVNNVTGTTGKGTTMCLMLNTLI